MIVGKVFRGLSAIGSDVKSVLKREIDFYKARPKSAMLMLTYECNSKCKTCNIWRRYDEMGREKEIGIDEWKIIIDKLIAQGVRTYELFGGNVLLRKEVLIQVCKYLYERGAIIHIPSNQIGLDDEIAEAFVKYVNTLYISTDAVGSRQDHIRGIDGSSQLGEDAVDKLLRLRREMNGNCSLTRIICNCTVSKFNIDAMEHVYQYAEDKGFDEVHFEYAGEFSREVVERSKIFGIVPDPHYLQQDESILPDIKGAGNIKANLKKIKKDGSGKRVKLVTANIDSLSEVNLYQGTIPHKKCYVERNNVTINPNGEFVPCAFMTNCVMGNMVESSFSAMWNNTKHKEFRVAQNSGKLPMCRYCILGVEWNPGFMKSLERIYYKRIHPHFI